MIHDAEFLLIVSILIIVALILAWQKVTYKAQVAYLNRNFIQLSDTCHELIKENDRLKEKIENRSETQMWIERDILC